VTSFFDQSKLDIESRIDSRTRAGRVFRAVYRDRVSRFDAMTTIPLTSRKTLADGFDLDLPSIAGRFDSKDGTKRYLLRFRDGETAESVLIPNSDRVTFCVSSQIGCALGCTFCLTGQMGLVRDLSAGEIVSQVTADAFVRGLRFPPDTFRVQVQIALIEQLEVIRRAQCEFLDHVSRSDGHQPLAGDLKGGRPLLRRRLHRDAGSRQDGQRERNRSGSRTRRVGVRLVQDPSHPRQERTIAGAE